MVLLRPSTRWSQFCRQSFRTARGHTCRRAGHHVQRRGYASEGGGAHGEHKSGSELPWAITSIGITIPAIYYLLQPQLNASNHGGGHGHGGHDEHGAESHEEGHSDESEDSGEHKSSEPADAEEQGKDEGQEGKKEDESTQDQAPSSEDSDDNSEGQPTPPTSDDSDSDSDTEVANTAHEKEGGANVPGVRFKGAMSGGTKEGEQGDTRKHIPDAKGFNKKRIESHSAIRLGEADQEHQSADNQDLGAPSKPPGGKNTQSGKQEGLSNTDTKHSTDISRDPDKSKKSDGSPETAKAKGTVDPHRNAEGER